MVLVPQFQYKFCIMVAVKKLLNEWIREGVDGSSKDGKDKLFDCEFVADVQPLGSFIMDGGFIFSNFNMIAIIPCGVPWKYRIDLQFVEKLRQDTATFQNIRVLQDAYVPALRFESQTIDIDIIFCHLGNPRIKDATNLNLFDKASLIGLGEVNLRALNSLRNCRTILDSVPNQAIYDAALQLIKIWAHTHDVYSSSMGYLGGISWCLMTAYVYLVFPQSTILGLVYGFFHVFANWNWEEPVVLPGATVPADCGPKKPMQIITPCEPVQNSSFTVTRSARRHIIRLISEANAKVESIGTLGESWGSLFITEHSLKFYNHFIKISIHFNMRTNADTIEFADFVESKLRLVINFLEEKNLRSTRLWSRRQTLPHEVFWLIGVTLPINKHLLHVREVKKFFVDYLHKTADQQMASFIGRLQFLFLTWSALNAENQMLCATIGKPSSSKRLTVG